jgi:nitroreductase
MNVHDAIRQRRAYRSLAPVEITAGLIDDLIDSARLFCSCFNNQPWRYGFVYDKDVLKNMHEALSQGNEWARSGSMIITVLSKPELDCQIRDRQYYQFDTGMATAAIILRATELGLVAHPIAGYSPKKVRAILNVPDDMAVIALVIVGKKAETMNPVLSEQQVKAEKERPARLPIDQIAFHNKYTGPTVKKEER